MYDFVHDVDRTKKSNLSDNISSHPNPSTP